MTRRIVVPRPSPMSLGRTGGMAYPFHAHTFPNGWVALMGDMSLTPRWPSDGTCPPACPLPKKGDSAVQEP